MKKTLFTILLLGASICMLAQPTGYYNGTEGKDGEDLKAELNDIISGHISYSYFYSKEIFKLSDADPGNSSNLILVYTGRSHPNSDYGTGGNQINREHVWAKSHGGFADIQPMDGDVHNLKPADASVNQDKSNKDFDNGGTQHPEATGCYFTDYTWEARDEVKGDIARIIFYMSTRYEGEDGEMDLEVVDAINTYPLPEHGKLSTLLEWNMQDPPDQFEMNRNNVIYSYQKNRNPFIDDPNYANLIWGGASASPVMISNVSQDPLFPVAGEPVNIEANITSGGGSITQAILHYGLSWNNLDQQVIMSNAGDLYSAQIPGYGEDQTVHYRISASDGWSADSMPEYNYYVPKIFSGTLTSIYDIQGQSNSSPFEGQTVSTSGVVTRNFGGGYFIQNGYGDWNGVYVYDPGRNPSTGDSLVLTGMIDEYYGLTEMKDISDFYFISPNHDLPDPKHIATGDAGEALEGVLVNVSNAVCTDANYQANYYMWTVNDGSGNLLIHNTALFEYKPVEGESYDITGPLHYDFEEWKIEIRFVDDVKDGSDLVPPEVDELEVINETVIKLQFSEPVEESSAENTANYSVNNGIVVQEANQHALVKSQVFLTVSTMAAGDYTLNVKDVEDLVGNIMEPISLEYTFVLGIDDLIVANSLSVFPNPAGELVNLEFIATAPSQCKLSLANVLGKVFSFDQYQIQTGKNTIQIDLSGLTSGVYILILETEDKLIQHRLIVR